MLIYEEKMVTLHWQPDITTGTTGNQLEQEEHKVLSTVGTGTSMCLVMTTNKK